MQTINEIYAVYPDLFEAEKRVADFVTNHQNEVLEQTVTELAAAAQTSVATVVRFCKKCGCTGFHQMKIRLAREMMDEGQEPVQGSISLQETGSSLQTILQAKTAELEQTFRNLDEQTVKTVVKKILAARTVLFAAMGNTIPAAMDGAYKFSQIGIQALSAPIWETQLALGRTLGKGDVVIAISASGASRHLLELAGIAREQGAVVVAITNHPQSPLAQNSSYHLTTATREVLFIEKVSFTRIPALAILEALFLLLMTERKGAAEHVNLHEQTVAPDKV